VLGDGGAERPGRAWTRQRGLELGLERTQLACRGAPWAPCAGETVPGAGEGEQVGPPAAAVGGEHGAHAGAALGVPAGDDRLGAHGLEHRDARALGKKLDRASQVVDRWPHASHRIADGHGIRRRGGRPRSSPLKGSLQ
jgi:hypothetical protein